MTQKHVNGAPRTALGAPDYVKTVWRVSLAFSLCCAALLAAPADARAFTLVDAEALRLELRGYVQSAGGFQDPGYEVPAVGSAATGFNAQVLRLQWTAQLGSSVTLDVHNRVVSQMTTSPLGVAAGDTIGIGASVVPGRTVDLRTTIVDDGGFSLAHDIDRLALRVFFDAGEVVAGRQAITWGYAMLFPVADLWTQFSPFELDQTEKPGTDALRVLYYPTLGLELDLIVADRGRLEDLSAGVRASMHLGQAGLYVAGGKFWNQLLAMAGVEYDFVDFKARAEVVEPYDTDSGRLRLPRATVGADYLGGDWSLSAEYHFNGTGAARPEDYTAQFADPAYARGESYYLNRHYLGAAASYSGLDRLRFSLGALANVTDPSVILTPSIIYELSDNADVTFGAFQGLGKAPVFEPAPLLHSEFGTYGSFYYAQLRGFF